MKSSSFDFCQRAIAYLKPALRASAGTDIEVPEKFFPVLTDLGNGLLIAYLVDEGNHFEYVQRHHLQESGLTETELRDLGTRNLALVVEQTLEVRAYGHVFVVLLGGNFEAGCILVDELWDETLSSLAITDFIAAIPCRDILAFCDASSSNGVHELRRIVARSCGGDHPITETLYRRTPEGWRPYSS